MWHGRGRIPPTPRGYSHEYTTYTQDERRVMARRGSRSPRGVIQAMQKYDVQSVDELVRLLNHHKARRRTGEKAHQMLIQMTPRDSRKWPRNRNKKPALGGGLLRNFGRG